MIYPRERKEGTKQKKTKEKKTKENKSESCVVDEGKI
jgi:hypothetical protein